MIWWAPRFDSGRWRTADAEGAITIRAGQARLGQTIARAEGADLAARRRSRSERELLDARLTLAASKVVAGGGRPEISIALKGPLAGRQADGRRVAHWPRWLTLRAIDQQAQQLEAIESQRRAAAGKRRGRPHRPRSREASAVAPPPEPAIRAPRAVSAGRTVAPRRTTSGPRPHRGVRAACVKRTDSAPELRPRPRGPAPPRANPPRVPNYSGREN